MQIYTTAHSQLAKLSVSCILNHRKCVFVQTESCVVSVLCQDDHFDTDIVVVTDCSTHCNAIDKD